MGVTTRSISKNGHTVPTSNVLLTVRSKVIWKRCVMQTETVPDSLSLLESLSDMVVSRNAVLQNSVDMDQLLTITGLNAKNLQSQNSRFFSLIVFLSYV